MRQGLNFRLRQIPFQLIESGLGLALFRLLAANAVGAGQQVLVQIIQLLFQIQHPALPQFQLSLIHRNGLIRFLVFQAQIHHLVVGLGVLFVGQSLSLRYNFGVDRGKLLFLLLNLPGAVVQGPLPAFHLVPLLGGQIQRHCQIGSGGAGFIGLLKLMLGYLDLPQAGLDLFQLPLLFFDLPGEGLDLPFPVSPPGQSADIPGGLLCYALPLQRPLAVSAIGGKPGVARRLTRKAGQDPGDIGPRRQLRFRPKGQWG